MLTRLEQAQNFLIGQHGRNRVETARKRLADDDDIRADAFLVLVGELAPGAAQTGLNFIGNQQDIVLFADFGDLFEIARRRNDHPGLALNRLNRNGGGVGGDGFLKGFSVTIRDGYKARSEGAKVFFVKRFG